MVIPYAPETGNLVMIDFDSQVGREQAERWSSLVHTIVISGISVPAASP
jgi:hypothetical protein